MACATTATATIFNPWIQPAFETSIPFKNDANSTNASITEGV